jgi:UPF0755 protein
MLRVLVTGVCLIVIAVAAAGWQVWQWWQQPLNVPGGGYALIVERGQSLAHIAARLDEDGVYAHPRLLRLYGRWSGLDQSVKRGEYRVPAGTTPESLLVLLSQGRVVTYQVTLPEGITLARAIEILAEQPVLLHELSGPDDQRLLAMTAQFPSPEGWFFPDSYQYERGASDWEILQRAHVAMQRALADEWRNRADGLPYESPYEALIMASIVERETGLPEERAEIAGVFVRRLQRRMRLQTDPTIIYGLGPDFDGNLRRSHLKDADNPYNTYRHRGLPPTPIALPGRDAIHAALHPLPGETLFFVARGDGGHHFSVTLAEHERAVRKYQLNRREDYRSSPESR